MNIFSLELNSHPISDICNIVHKSTAMVQSESTDYQLCEESAGDINVLPRDCDQC